LIASQILWVIRASEGVSGLMAPDWPCLFRRNWTFLVGQFWGMVQANAGATPMYVPPAFREDDLAALHAMMRAARLANLVTATAEGLVATPLPLFLAPEEGPYGTLYGHLGRANPQWRLPPKGDALALFTGPDAYISPSWYPSKAQHGKVVPTWNYVAVHAYGPVEFFDDPDRLLEVVTRLTELHEQPRAEPWAVGDAPPAFVRAQLKGIVGLRLPIARIEGKRKMSQNRSAADRAGVAAGLGASDPASERAAAALIPT
jgi:transcriptional regulator